MPGTRRVLSIAIALTFFPMVSEAQDSPAIPKSAVVAAKRDAQASVDALLRGDFERFAAFVYPRALKFAGGKERMIASVQRGVEEMRAQGARLESASAGQPEQMMRAGADLLTIIPVEQVATVEDGQILFSSHLLGVSSDNGRSWTFVDTLKLTPENVRSFIPNFNSALKLPTSPTPTYVPASPPRMSR